MANQDKHYEELAVELSSKIKDAAETLNGLIADAERLGLQVEATAESAGEALRGIRNLRVFRFIAAHRSEGVVDGGQ